MNISSIYANVTGVASVEGIRQTHIETERKNEKRKEQQKFRLDASNSNIVMKGSERCILAARDNGQWSSNSKAEIANAWMKNQDAPNEPAGAFSFFDPK